MKTRARETLLGIAMLGLALPALGAADDAAGERAVAETRQLLRAQGFKTGLSEFNLFTTPEFRAREAVLTNTSLRRSVEPFREPPNLLLPIGNDSALVVWLEEKLPLGNRGGAGEEENLTWAEFRAALNLNQSLYDPACRAILAGPIRFNLEASQGSNLRLPQLAVMKDLAQAMGQRTMLALHEGQLAAAFTNLMAATRLATAYEPGPLEIAHLVRFGCAGLAYNTTWQALQTNGWTDEQLSRLQREWESVDYFSPLPETAAFSRASSVADCERKRTGEDDPKPTFGEFMKAAVQSPPSVAMELRYRWERAHERPRGNFKDEQELMIFYRDREVELREAVKAPTWAAMSRLPGVTNAMPLRGSSAAREQFRMNLGRMGAAAQMRGSIFLSRAAEAEAQRRILICALALERYRVKHGSYPGALAALTPEFLKTPLPDFMDGQPLRYRLAADGHFLLYSVGLDGVDNGGKLRRSWRDLGYERRPYLAAQQQQFDLVWPRPGGTVARQEEQQIQTKTKQLEVISREAEHKHYLKEISAREWEQSPSRQSRVVKSLAMNWTDPDEEPTLGEQKVTSLLGNASLAGTNQHSICALLTPKQILTGREPEDITFELPIRYDAFTNGSILHVVVDGEPEDNLKFDSGGKVTDLQRAANGDCVLVWHAIYDPPGQHAAQVYVALDDKRAVLYMFGPPIAVTTSNLCQFSLDSANYEVESGAIFHARLPEANARYTIECLTTNGEHLKTLSGSTTNGEFKTVWDLVDEHGHRLTGETFNSTVQITLPDSGRTQTLRGP